jgi:hypothetical protein
MKDGDSLGAESWRGGVDKVVADFKQLGESGKVVWQIVN